MRITKTLWGLIALLAFLGLASTAYAHTSERGYILLLPTEYYLLGGTLSVALSFMILSLSEPRAVIEAFRGGLNLPWIPAGLFDTVLSAIGFLSFAGLLYCGVEGARDPLTNPLPMVIWTIGWIGVTVAHAVFGNFWSVLNPWRFPVRLVRRLVGASAEGVGPVSLPNWAKGWPAILLFMGIAWYELVSLSPEDPDLLAFWVLIFWGIGFIGCLLFGEAVWLRAGEPLSVLFRYLSLLAPISVKTNPDGRRVLCLSKPGSRVLDSEPASLAISLFLLLSLATVSFDGLSMTFWWLGLNDINPLEFPGRSAVTGINSVGLLLAWITLAALYGASVWGGEWLRGARDAKPALGLMVLSILPIALAYHISHYLTYFLVNAQWVLIALNDPLATGANLLGLQGFRVTASFLNSPDSVERIWQIQVAAISIGHIWAVILAHGLSSRLSGGRPARHLVGQIPLGLLMVAYTLFGLWLLSSPTGG
ncbi:MAG: hypothetical protein P1V34_02275 [Alphaproteobacteria bacterium]|nr:hypothetical protein [Alphaproteobacteria bacterium]